MALYNDHRILFIILPFLVSVTAFLITIYLIVTISYDFKEAVLESDPIDAIDVTPLMDPIDVPMMIVPSGSRAEKLPLVAGT